MTSPPERYLERAADAAVERAKLAAPGLAGHELRAQLRERDAAEREVAIEVAVSPRARELAVELAAEGDDEAAAALERAGQIDAAFVAAERLIRRTARSATSPQAPEDPAPLRELREQLADARAAGIAFEVAWPAAVACVGADQSGAWRAAAEATWRAWAVAYAGEESTGRTMADVPEPGGEWSERPSTQVAA